MQRLEWDMKLYPLFGVCALLASGVWSYGRPYAGSGYPGARPLLRTSASVSRPVWMAAQRMPNRPYVMYKAPGKASVRYSKPLPATSKYAAPKSPQWKAHTRTAPSGPAEPLRASASGAHPLRVDFPFSGGASYTSITGSGPIHTIPAPNLSLARKPIVVADQSSQQAEYRPEVSKIQPVTLSSPELLQLVRNAHQQMPETYGMPIFAQPQVLQPHNPYVPQIHLRNYVQPNLPQLSQTVLQPNILFKPEPSFIQQIQSQEYKLPGFPQSDYRGPSPQSARQTQIYEFDKKEETADSQKLHYNVVRETNEGFPKVQTFHPSKQIFEFINPNITNNGAAVVEISKDVAIPLKEFKDTIVGEKQLKDDTVENKLHVKAAAFKIPKNNTVEVIKPKKNTFEVAKAQPDVNPNETLVEIKKSKDTAIISDSPKRQHLRVTTLNDENKVEIDKRNIATDKVKKSNFKNKENSIFYSQIGDNVDNYVTNGFYAALTEAKAAEALTDDENAVKNSTETNNTKVPPELVPYFSKDSSLKLNETSNEILVPLHGIPFTNPTADSTPEPVVIQQNETLSNSKDISMPNLDASESTNIPVISAVNKSFHFPNVEKEEFVENVTELPVEKESLKLVLKADTIEPETTQVFSNVTVDEKTGEPVIRIYASYKPRNEQKDDNTYSIADTNVGGIKMFASSNPHYHEDWKSSGGYKSVPGISFGSGINQISEFGLKLRPKLHELETLLGMEK